MAKRPVARVLPESRLPQLDRVFDYVVPDGMDAPVGCRVKVPIGRSAKLHTGFVVERPESSDFGGELSPIDQVLSPVSVLTDEVLESARALAKRQAGGVADVLRLAIPPRAVRVEKKWLEVTREAPILSLPALGSRGDVIIGLAAIEPSWREDSVASPSWSRRFYPPRLRRHRRAGHRTPCPRAKRDTCCP